MTLNLLRTVCRKSSTHFAFLLLTLAIANELLRIIVKGWDHGFSTFNDLWFYRAMSESIADYIAPTPPSAELSELLKERLDVREYYAGFHGVYLDERNGLSSQPPYVFRPLLPAITAAFRLAGASFVLAANLIQVAAVAAIGYGVSGLLRSRDTDPCTTRCLALFCAGVFAAVSAPGYPDALAAALGLFAFRKVRDRRALGAAALLSLATLCRETSIAYTLGVVLFPFPNKRSTAFAILLPLFVLLSTRMILGTGSQSFNPGELFSERLSSQVVLQSVSASALLFPIVLVLQDSHLNFHRTKREAWTVYFCVAFGALALSLMATNVSRMSLLMLPLLFVPLRSQRYIANHWISSALGGLTMFAACDQLQDIFGYRFQWHLCSLLLLTFVAGRSRRQSIAGQATESIRTGRRRGPRI